VKAWVEIPSGELVAGAHFCLSAGGTVHRVVVVRHVPPRSVNVTVAAGETFRLREADVVWASLPGPPPPWCTACGEAVIDGDCRCGANVLGFGREVDDASA
jgi:hypothetical protein